MSPPRPVASLLHLQQHNYSNLQQPPPITAPVPLQASSRPPHSATPPSGPGSLPSRDQDQKGKSESPVDPNGAGAFSRSAVRPRTPPAPAAPAPLTSSALMRLSEVRDLIHLETPLGEDAILRALQARFFNQKYYVSIIPEFPERKISVILCFSDLEEREKRSRN